MRSVILEAAKTVLKKPGGVPVRPLSSFPAAFRTWFGKSKVVDANGNPLPVYHGTASHFYAFDRDEAPERGGLIAFFSTSPKFAANYADYHAGHQDDEAGSGGSIMPVYLRIEDPFDFRKRNVAEFEVDNFYDEYGGIQDRTEIDRMLGLGMEDTPPNRRKIESFGKEQFKKLVLKGSWDALEAPEFVEYLHAQGYDGIITKELSAVNYGVFDSRQVKSAIANIGKYDPGSPKINETQRP